MKPMLATRADPGSGLPSGPGWTFEVKWDGVRVLADVGVRGPRLYSRSGRDVTVAYPELAALAGLGAGLPGGVLLDGEVVALVEGKPSFAALAARMHVQEPGRAELLARARPVTYVVFDVLRVDGTDLRAEPFSARRARLEGLDLPGCALLSPVYDDGEALLAATVEQGLEGVVAKRLNGRYEAGRRSSAWVKTSHRRTRTALVVGWRPETGGGGTGGARLGAVLLGARDESGTLQYLGRAGSGLTGPLGGALSERLAGLGRLTSALDVSIPAVDQVATRWVEPTVLVDVGYLLRTAGGRLRQPVVRGLRDDVEPDPWELP